MPNDRAYAGSDGPWGFVVRDDDDSCNTADPADLVHSLKWPGAIVLAGYNWLFQAGDESPCWDAADANDDSEIDVGEAVYLSNYISLGGPEPPPRFDPDFDPDTEVLDVDPTADLLGCQSDDAGQEIDW